MKHNEPSIGPPSISSTEDGQVATVSGPMTAEKVRLRIGSLAKAVLITGQAYQDPKDALNEFISNAADEYAQAEMKGERIRVLLRRRGRYPVVAIDDDGRGMSPERLREVAQNLFKSVKVDDDRTLGEKAIGLLAFQQLGGRCEIVSRASGSSETWCLKLWRGKATAELVKERRRARSSHGTTVYLADLDPEVLRTITQRKVVDYLRKRRGAALARGDYVIEVQEGRTSELVTPERPEGLRVPLPAQRTLWGTIEFNIYVSPDSSPKRQVSVVGGAGTTIVDNILEIEELDEAPWNVGQVAGEVIFPGLQQTAGRRGGRKAESAERIPSLDELTPAEPPTPQPEAAVPQSARPGGSRSARLPSIAPDPDPGDNRSRFDPDAGVVLYNEGHADYLLQGR